MADNVNGADTSSSTAGAALPPPAPAAAPSASAAKACVEDLPILRWTSKWFNDVKEHKSKKSVKLTHQTCLFRFGIVTDSQYADLDDGTSFFGDKRWYRNSLVMLNRAFKCWNECPGEISFIAQLGDLIDGQANDGKGGTEKALAVVEKAMVSKLPPARIHHLVGNHELYNFEHRDMSRSVSLFKAHPRLYHSWIPYPGWRCICLDPYDISTLCSDATTKRAAWSMIRKNNPNCDKTEDKMRAGVNWVGGLTGPEQRWVPYNGAVSEGQLKWLVHELKAAVTAKQRILVFSHVSFEPGACRQDCLLFNYQQVVACMDRYAKGHVGCAFYGHDHIGGYHHDDARGIHHVTFEAPLETDPSLHKFCHAVVEIVDPNTVVVRGAGKVPSRLLRLRPLPSHSASASSGCVHGAKCRLDTEACAQIHPQKP